VIPDAEFVAGLIKETGWCCGKRMICLVLGAFVGKAPVVVAESGRMLLGMRRGRSASNPNYSHQDIISSILEQVRDQVTSRRRGPDRAHWMHIHLYAVMLDETADTVLKGLDVVDTLIEFMGHEITRILKLS
jgi:hypothetical protein